MTLTQCFSLVVLKCFRREETELSGPSAVVWVEDAGDGLPRKLLVQF